MKSTAKYHKRIYNLSTFRRDIRSVIAHLDDLREASRGGRISRAFAEKIMLAVSLVNGCRYCTFGHTRAALSAGVPESELKKLFDGQLAEFPQEEAIALTFAQHYAEQNGQPDPLAWQRVVDYYGEQTAGDILAYLRMITFGNLLGNTFDALLSRLAGKPAPDSRVIDEVGVILGAITIFPLQMILRSLGRWLPCPTRRMKEMDTL